MSGTGIEDRLALQDMLVGYCRAIDRRPSADDAAAYYVEDGVLDNSAVGAPVAEGRAAVRAMIDGMFTSMASLEHYLSNFLVETSDTETAQLSAYVVAHGQPNGGDAFSMRGAYAVDASKVDGAWRIARLTFKPFG